MTGSGVRLGVGCFVFIGTGTGAGIGTGTGTSFSCLGGITGGETDLGTGSMYPLGCEL